MYSGYNSGPNMYPGYNTAGVGGYPPVPPQGYSPYNAYSPSYNQPYVPNPYGAQPYPNTVPTVYPQPMAQPVYPPVPIANQGVDH